MLPKHKRKFFGILFLFFLYTSTAGSMLWFNVASQRKPGSFGVADTLKTIPHNSDAVIDIVYVAESCIFRHIPGRCQILHYFSTPLLSVNKTPTIYLQKYYSNRVFWYITYLRGNLKIIPTIRLELTDWRSRWVYWSSTSALDGLTKWN